jgi:CheY-like chemotaxis protein
VSRILVADDNSNIQKMVALALKDEGIDVVAVGNGDAAMRKIPDLRPDLVLADIFMPVRNGYEVCEFVKSDSRYMNTPVVLLVGAFDPLDEQETQRVRADGVLKKPFVPPDPLINMVKALLAKSNGQKAEPVMVAAPIKAAPPRSDAPAPESQPAPSNQVGAAPTQVSTRDDAKISSPVQAPPAFVKSAQRSEPQAANAEDSDEVVTAARDPNLGDPFWASPEETEEPEENTETDPKDMVDMHSFGKAGHSDDEEEDDRPHFRPDSALLDSADLAVDVQEPLVSPNKGAAQETNRSHAMPVDEGESNAVVAQSKNAAPSALSEPALEPTETPAEIFKFDPTLTFATSTQEEPIERESAKADHAPLMEAKALEPIEHEPALLSWTEATEATAETPVAAEKPLDTHERVAPIELELPALPNREAVISAATEAARLAFSEMNTLPGSGASADGFEGHTSGAKQKESLAASAPGATPTSATPEMIEAVVSRLLERMQPQIMEVVNREVLRPAIEAIVRQEMKKA